MLSPCQYQRLKISKVQTPVRSSWSDLGKKAARVSTSSRTAFIKEKNVSKIPGLKIESDSETISIGAIKGKLGLFELSNFCQTVCSAFSSGMGR